MEIFRKGGMGFTPQIRKLILGEIIPQMWSDILKVKVLAGIVHAKAKNMQKIETKTVGPCLNGPGQKKLKTGMTRLLTRWYSKAGIVTAD